ncbi:MAG TPA: glycerophosphodiester phosphodiesterase family protein [Candidatus Saccharimonadales bacterium]|nr:glycerophosphodiester phosphodiesterase family protein [Candidatus Saccharimonadales bacterium]
MTRIIGHRGAAGLALENSADSIRAALKHDVDAIEFDIHLTKDKKLIVVHDKHTGRVSRTKVHIKDATLDELRNLPLKNGQTLPTLDEIMDIIGGKPVIIDIKDAGSAAELLQVLKRHPRAHVSFASFQHEELRFLHERLPKVPIYVLEHFSPVDIIHSAVNLRAHGIGLNKWLMNPLTSYLARRYHLDLYVYTVNNRFLGLVLKRLYPGVTICTDHPERFSDLRED